MTNTKKKKVTMKTKSRKDTKNMVSLKTKENGGKRVVDCGMKTNKEGGGITYEVNIFFLQ